MNENRWVTSGRMRQSFEWDKWCKEIPQINFDKEWGVRIIPPFGCAVVRFGIVCGKADLSIYLDCYDELGYFGEPYWELYPHKGDVARFKMKDITGLKRAIRNEINRKNKRK